MFFDEVSCAKPQSSRVSSLEAFVVCKKFRRTAAAPLCAWNIYNSDCTYEIRDCNGGDDESLPMPSSQRDTWTAVDAHDAHDAHDAYSSGGAVVPFVLCGDLSGYDCNRNYAVPSSSTA
eukprot:Lankesteria_metandrocarpae@DN6700_c0_g1_i1.p1